MVFNVGAIPFTVCAMGIAWLVWKYRLPLTRLSDRFYGWDRTPEQQERWARFAWIGIAWATLLSLFALFMPFE